MILIYDYGVGNAGSIQNMINRLGFNSVVGSEPSLIEKTNFCIIPGVGSFDTCVEEFNNKEGSQILLNRISEGLNILGICVGMQMLFEKSEEGKKRGLNLIPGRVQKFNSYNKEFKEKMPHMSWNHLDINSDDVSYKNFEERPKFYFVHSYHAVCSDKFITAYADYGHKFPASVQKGNIRGVQFHPEKSHVYGMTLFRNLFANET